MAGKGFSIEDKLTHFKINDTIKNYIDGLILGDGSVFPRRNHYYYRQRFAMRYEEWADVIANKLNDFGIRCKYNTYIRKSCELGGICYPDTEVIDLWTLYYPQLEYFRKRWYPNGKKVIPDDLDLTPELIANWYMGDGSIHKYPKYYKNKKYSYWQIMISTSSFEESEVETLRMMLVNKGYKATKHKDRKWWLISINYQDSIRDFLKSIESHKVECFDYKWRALI